MTTLPTGATDSLMEGPEGCPGEGLGRAVVGTRRSMCRSWRAEARPRGACTPLENQLGPGGLGEALKMHGTSCLEPPSPQYSPGRPSSPRPLSPRPTLIWRHLCPQSCRTSSLSELTREHRGATGCIMLLSCELVPPGPRGKYPFH